MLSELSDSQLKLAKYMSELSEQAFSAGWMSDLEYSLWRAVNQGPFKYGQLELTVAHTRRLLELSGCCGGWIVFIEDHEESFMPIEEWRRTFLHSSKAPVQSDNGENAL